ncbi:MAG: HAMP domain-containing histidine kinase [Alphaproteobacteria bacterium]|nr:HAMP domain-containing histidine kinase [Alphaproteobacteria bacterium]
MARIAIDLPPLARGLSARLLVLTIIFVLIGEVFIYVPSIARFRQEYLSQRIAAARLAALTVEAIPDQMVDQALGYELLRHAGVRAISLKREGSRTFILADEMPQAIAATYDLDGAMIFGLIRDGFETLWHSDWEAIRVVSRSPKDRDPVWVDVVVDAQPLRRAMLEYSERILVLSLVLAGITATMIYLSIHFLLVRPMRRMTQSLVSFQRDPENPATDIRVTTRGDEIGVAQRELNRLQGEVRQSLRRQARLAGVGAAVSKINHDLRNMLSTAAVLTDRLAFTRDPEVQRLAQPLLHALDRAINLCAQTLAFARADEAHPAPQRFALRALVDEVAADLLTQSDGQVGWRNAVPEPLEIEADRDQLFRALFNLVRNAAEALHGANGGSSAPARAGLITVEALAEVDRVTIDVIDNGPGLSEKARAHLFEAFTGAGRSGGTGLGLIIARDLVRNHGGQLSLARTGAEGTIFRIVLPVRRARSAAA